MHLEGSAGIGQCPAPSERLAENVFEPGGKILSASNAQTISIIIPVHNGGADFVSCLTSVAAAASADEEVIVVADGDTDGSRLLAHSFGVRVLKLDTPHGPAGARNVGARAARGDILFFMDADVAISPGTFERIAHVLRQDPDVAAVFGSYDDEPAVPKFLSQYKNLFHHYVHQNGRLEASTFWAGCGAIRRDAFLSIGGFDESYRRPSIEDIELGYRLRRGGYRIRLDKTLQVKHLKRWTAPSLLQSDFWCRAVPWAELIMRDRRFINDLNLRVSSGISVALAYGLLLSLIGATGWTAFYPAAAILGAVLVIMNAPLYWFFCRKRGLWFALRAIPWHWLYYLYGGLGFVVGLVRYLFAGFSHRNRAASTPRANIPASSLGATSRIAIVISAYLGSRR
jgi:GT2 family glycosyltransferase